MKRPIMDDLNGDGIPDGAQVTIKYTKGMQKAEGGSLRPEGGRRPVMEAEGAVQMPAPVPVSRQMMPAETPPETYEGRTNQAADLMGIRRVGGAPVSRDATRQFLQARMGEGAIRPELRAAAGQRLAVMDEADTRASAQASEERRTGMEAAGVAGAAEANRDARTAAAEATGQARVEAAQVTAAGRVQEAETKARAAEAREATRNQMLLDARDERKAAREAKTSDQRNRWVTSAMDREYEVGNGVVPKKQTLRGYATSTRDVNGNLLQGAVTDPVWESRLDAIQEQADGWGVKLFNAPGAGEATARAAGTSAEHGIAVARKKGEDGKYIYRDVDGKTWTE